MDKPLEPRARVLGRGCEREARYCPVFQHTVDRDGIDELPVDRGQLRSVGIGKLDRRAGDGGEGG